MECSVDSAGWNVRYGSNDWDFIKVTCPLFHICHIFFEEDTSWLEAIGFQFGIQNLDCRVCNADRDVRTNFARLN